MIVKFWLHEDKAVLGRVLLQPWDEWSQTWIKEHFIHVNTVAIDVFANYRGWTCNANVLRQISAELILKMSTLRHQGSIPWRDADSFVVHLDPQLIEIKLTL